MVKCLGCRFPITWREQRAQFGRLMRRGLSEADTKAIMPRCQKCITVTLREPCWNALERAPTTTYS